jgi:hypothetical protein
MSENPDLKIVKPEADFLTKFMSKRPPTIAGVETLPTALPVLRLGAVADFFRLHPSEENYWSPELCFVNVPIKGVKEGTIYLIDEDLAMEHLSSNRVKRMRLALASKPHDVFFFAIVPSQNLENSWNATAIDACERAKTSWVQVSSRKGEGIEAYKIDKARDHDAFPAPRWPTRSLAELIEITFRGICIDAFNHPAMCRLIGARPDLT